MEIKKGLGLVLLVLGMVAVSQARQTDADDADQRMSDDRRGRVFAAPYSEERYQEHQEEKREERSEKQKTKQSGDRRHFPFCYPCPAMEDEAKKLYFDLAVGMIKYTMPKTTVINAGGGADTVSLTHAPLIPMIRGGMGVEFIGLRCLTDDENTTRARLGLQVTFGKKNGHAIETLYTGTASTTPLLNGTQDVTRGELMTLFAYDLIRDLFSLEGGFGVVGGALKDFNLYQQPTSGSDVILSSYFTGQTLKAQKASFGGFVGATLCYRFKHTDRLRLDFSYRCVFNSVSYQTRIYQTQPGINASQTYQNGFSLTQSGSVVNLPSEPKFKVRAQEMAFGIVAEF